MATTDAWSTLWAIDQRVARCRRRTPSAIRTPRVVARSGCDSPRTEQDAGDDGSARRRPATTTGLAQQGCGGEYEHAGASARRWA